MSRRRSIVLILIAASTALTVAAIRGGRVETSEFPLWTVESRPFTRSVIAEGYLRGATATPISVPPEAPAPLRIAWRIADGAPVESGEVLIRFDDTEMARELLAGRSDTRIAGHRIESAAVERDTTDENLRRDLDLAQRELTAAERYRPRDDDIFSRVEIERSAIDSELARQKKRHAEEIGGSKRALSSSDLELLRLEDAKAKRRVARAQDGLSALELRAPHAGIVVFERDWRGNDLRVGDMVWSGAKLAELPDLAAMEAEVMVLEADAGGLAVGQRATVVPEAFPHLTWSGRVRRVDSVARRRVRGSPVQYFSVSLELDTSDPEHMTPGQSVTARLILDELPEAIVVPRQAVFSDEEGRFVHLLASDGFQRMPVVTASTSRGWIVIESGLAPGARIALGDPGQDLRDAFLPDSPKGTP